MFVLFVLLSIVVHCCRIVSGKISDGRGGSGGKGGNHGRPVAGGPVKWGTSGTIVEGRGPGGAYGWQGSRQEILDVADGGNTAIGPLGLFTTVSREGAFDGGPVGGTRLGEGESHCCPGGCYDTGH